MNKIKSFLDKWIKFKVYDTQKDGIYQIYAGIFLKGEIDLSNKGFNLYFGSDKSLSYDYKEYGFTSLNSFKRAAVLSLYFIARVTAEEIVAEHIINAIRSGMMINETNPRKYIWEGESDDGLQRWSIFMDFSKFE